MADGCQVLSQDCWELIFNLVDDDNLEAISLVCKEFFTISNRIRCSLNVYNHPSIRELRQLLQRFRGLKTIDLSKFSGNLDGAVHEIAQSGLNLEALDLSYQKTLPLKSLTELGSASMKRSLKTLKCRNVCVLRNSEIAAIVNSLPWLEELDIGYSRYYWDDDSDSVYDWDYSNSNSLYWDMITDAGIEVLASKLTNLRKVNIYISGYCLSHQSFLALSSNCVYLTEIVAWHSNITQNCIGFLFRHCPNLVCLSADEVEMGSSLSSPSYSSFTIENSIAYAKALRVLKFCDTVISDSLLRSIAEAHIPLKTLTLNSCPNFSIFGLSLVLQACQSLEEFDVEGFEFLTDEYMRDLSKFLANITYINLTSCDKLTSLGLFTLIKNCPSLLEIIMEHTMEVEEHDFDVDIVKNHQVQFLKLAWNPSLRDESLKRIALSCPNLQFLDLSHCVGITHEGLGEIFKSCKKLRHLKLYAYSDSKIFGSNSELSELNLEVLNAPDCDIDDKGMAMIAERCRGLLRLNLTNCGKVTWKGVKEVAEKCRKLKDINLRECCNVSADFLAWMVWSRPSLRTFCDFVPKEDQIMYRASPDFLMARKTVLPEDWLS